MKRLAIAIIFACLFYGLGAQNTIGLPLIINYSKYDFKAGTQTWDIKQDSKGMMYFANNDGLVTFDGKYWKLYPIPNKTILRSLAIDKNDRVYAGAQNELGYFAPNANGTLSYVSLKNLMPKPQNEFADIWDIEIFGESVFFRATDRIFELRNNTIQVYSSTTEWRFLKKTGGRLFSQDKTSGLLEYRNNGWYPLNNQKLFIDKLISGMSPVGNDSILVTTLKDGVFIMHKDSVIARHTDIDPELKSSQVYVSAMMNSNEFVAGTTSKGCFILNTSGKLVQRLSHTESLQNNNVLCVYLDKDKNLWAGLDNGISFIAYNSAIKYIRPNKSNELASYSARIFNNQLYVATSDGTHKVALTGENRDFSFCKGDFTQIHNSTGQVWRLDEVNQQLLMGYNDGIFVIHNDAAEPLAQGTGAWLFVPTNSVFPATDILVGTYTGLHMLGFAGNNFNDVGKMDGLPESFRFLAMDNNGNVWSSHPYRGVFRIKLVDKKRYDAQLYTDKDGLPNSLGNYVYRIKSRVVFATEKGVYEFDDEKKRFIKSPFLGPVFGNMEVRYLTEDADGNIWFCSGKQLGVVNFSRPSGNKSYTITYFPEVTGQILTGFENIYPYNKENIFIGSEKGVIHIDYAKYVTNKLKLSVLLGQVRAIGKTDSTIFGGYTGGGDPKKPLRLPNDYNSFHFEYSSPSYGLQNNIEYSYQLIGYDEKWSAWTTRTEKDYTNLPYGKYTFRVKAHDNLGNESEPITYTFVVKPAWYNTVWAYLLYVLLLALGVYAVRSWQKKKLHAQQEHFDEEQKRLKYIHQLELEKNEKEIIKLQNEKLANEVRFKNKELADASMHLVERGDALAKIKDELQKLYKNTGNNHDVKKVMQLLNDAERNNANWEQFASHFDEVNNDFLKKLKSRFPTLSNTDLKVCAYLQLNLSSKEIAQLMNISVRGVEISRYRLRKKLQLPTEQTLNDFLNSISGD